MVHLLLLTFGGGQKKREREIACTCGNNNKCNFSVLPPQLNVSSVAGTESGRLKRSYCGLRVLLNDGRDKVCLINRIKF